MGSRERERYYREEEKSDKNGEKRMIKKEGRKEMREGNGDFSF